MRLGVRRGKGMLRPGLSALLAMSALGAAEGRGAEPGTSPWQPARVYLSATGSLGGPRFLLTPERKVQEYEAQVMAQFGISGVNARTFRDEASSWRLWVPGVGVIWDPSPKSRTYLELGYGKGAIRTHQAFAETHIPGVPLPNTGALTLDAKFTREAVYLGSGVCLYPYGREARWSPFVNVGLGYEWTNGSGEGTLDHAGQPPYVPGSVNHLGWAESGKGFTYALGAGVDIRQSRTWSTSLIGRYTWGTARGNTDAEVDEFTLAVVASFDLRGGKR